MKPAFSIVVFSTVAGAAQGVAVVAAAATLAGTPPGGALHAMLWTATLMLVFALATSFLHLGHPLRAWRAVLMWRTSWMSREVIVLPTLVALLIAWTVLASSSSTSHGILEIMAVLAICSSFLLWYCTAKIYACLRFIQEWAHPFTLINYVLLGLASGLVISGALAALYGEETLAKTIGPWAFATTGLAWFTRLLSLRRNARLKPNSTTQSATGIQSPHVVQTSMGLTAGSFNTREFFHGTSARIFSAARSGFQLLAFCLPLLLLGWALTMGSVAAWLLAVFFQAIGLLVERWFFFAQANHPQNIYYQVVS